MHKVELWLPTKTYNKLVNDTMANGGDVSQKAANLLYARLNGVELDGLVWPFKEFDHPVRDPEVEEVLNKFIAPTVMTGISQDDLIMNGLDMGLNYDDICNCIQALIDEGIVTKDNRNRIHFKYDPNPKDLPLQSFKNEKVIKKQVTQQPLFVKKINRT